MQRVSFWTPVIYDDPKTAPQLLGNFIESTFYLGGPRVHLLPPHYNRASTRQDVEPIWRIALKVAALFFMGRYRVPVLVGLFLAKAIYRFGLRFALDEPSRPPAQSRASKIEKQKFLKLVKVWGDHLKTERKISRSHVVIFKIPYRGTHRKILYSIDPSKHLKIQEVTKLLGRGGFGKVYELKDWHTRSVTVLKIATPSKKDKKKPDLQQAAKDDLRKEYKTLKFLNPQGTETGIQTPPLGPLLKIRKGVVISKDKATVYEKTKLGFEGKKYDGSLDKLQLHYRSLRIRFKILLQLAKGIAHYRKKGLVHSDLKPANTLYRQENGTYLAHISDFGSAWSEKKATGPSAYTPGYTNEADADRMFNSLTQSEKHCAGKESDIYSLGMTFYELLTGHRIKRNTDIQQSLNSAGLKGTKYEKFINVLTRMLQESSGLKNHLEFVLDKTGANQLIGVGRPPIQEVIDALESLNPSN